MALPWAKLYTEMLDDPAIGRLTDRQFRLFTSLILLARSLDDEGVNDGFLVQNGVAMTLDDIAWRLRMNPADVAEDMAVLMQWKDPEGRAGLITTDDDGRFIVTAFQKRQQRRPSEEPEATRDRQHRHREVQRAAPVTEQMSRPCHDHVTTPDIESESESESDPDREPQTTPAADAEAETAESLLKAAGVSVKRRAVLVADGWTTPERVQAALGAIRKIPNVRSPPGLLVAMLRDHQEFPRDGPVEDRYRYIQGEYAQFIQH